MITLISGGFGKNGFYRQGFDSSQFVRKGQDLRAEVSITFEEAAFGCDKVIHLQSPDGRGSTQSLQVILQNEGNVILSEGLVLQDAGLWGKTLDEISTPFNNRMELYFEEFDIDGLLAKYESGKYFVRYATELTEIAGGQKLVRLYDPSGNLIEVRTPFMSN